MDSPASCVSLSWDILLLLALCFVLNVQLVFVCLFGAICFLEFFVKFVICGSCVFALCVCVCVYVGGCVCNSCDADFCFVVVVLGYFALL